MIGRGVPYAFEVRRNRVPVWNPSTPVVPFDAVTGHMLTYAETWNRLEWRMLTPFTAQLTLDKVNRGCSAAHFFWRDENGWRYPMFLTDLVALLNSVGGVATGRTRIGCGWRAVKRGQNYGISLVGES